MLTSLFLIAALSQASNAQLVTINAYTLPGIIQVARVDIQESIEENLPALNNSLTAAKIAFDTCQQQITNQLYTQCAQCISDKCIESAQERCSPPGGSPQQPTKVKPNIKQIACIINAQACHIIDIAEKAVSVVKKGIKGIGKVVKNIFGRIRIRLPRIRLPRIRLPRIRLPRIRLPRIRLPRIRLPRIRLPRIRLPRIRISRGWRRKREAEPTCQELESNANACIYYERFCESCTSFQSQTLESQVITDICGSPFNVIYSEMAMLEGKLEQMTTLYDVTKPNVFSIFAVKYNPANYVGAGNYSGIVVNYLALGKPYDLTVSTPFDPNNPMTAGMVIGEEVFKTLFP